MTTKHFFQNAFLKGKKAKIRKGMKPSENSNPRGKQEATLGQAMKHSASPGGI